MTELLAIAIGIGLAVSLIFSELFGLAAGGMVVPGYFALYLNNPMTVGLTIAASVATYFVVYLFSSIVIVYGKRRTALMILVGYLIRMLMESYSFTTVHQLDSLITGADFDVIGYIIPGLIAIWIDRQGMVETLSTLLTASIVVRLILLLIYGSELPQ